MRSLKSYIQKPYTYVVVGKEKIRKFGEFHIIALEKAAIPEFAPILAAIKAIYQAMFGSIVSRDQMESERQAATIQLNQKMEAFKEKALEIEPLVEYKLKKSGFIEEFYPHGTSEIHHITQANAITLMTRFENASLKHETALGTPFSDIFKAIRLDYEDAVALQKGLKGSVKFNIPDYEIKKEELFDQMYCNILTIAAHYYKTPEKTLAFFDESILLVRKHKADDEGEKPLDEQIPPNTTLTPDITFSADDTILLSNVSETTSAFWYGGDTPNEAPKTAPNELLPGEEIEIPAATLGKYLILLNKDTVKTAEVEIMLV
jgi:hypothetical protein